MLAAKQYKLELTSVLQAIDKRDLTFYNRLTDEERKGYVPLILMRYISSVTDQNKSAAYAVLATNDLVNVGFWQLDKHKELQHMLLCLCGLGGKQYRPWLSAKSRKTSNKIFDFLLEMYPNLNQDELSLIYNSFTNESFKDFVLKSGINDQEVKALLAEWKKQKK
jgi:hypothetical protein